MAAAPMAPSAAAPLKRKQPQQAAPLAAKRAKTYLLPPVRGQKCGKCKHCLNPQMKKKCLEVERKQKEELAARDELPLSLMGGESMLEAQRRQQLSNRPGSGSIPPAPAPQQAAARAQPTAAQIAFQNSLRAVLVNDEIHPARAEDFARLMAQQASNTNSSRKELLLTIVQRSSSPELLAVLVGSGVVDQLHRWLQAARDVQDDKWLASLLAALRHLPITVDVLGRSSLGKTVNKLTKTLQGPVQEQALALVQQWRAIVSKRLLFSHHWLHQIAYTDTLQEALALLILDTWHCGGSFPLQLLGNGSNAAFTGDMQVAVQASPASSSGCLSLSLVCDMSHQDHHVTCARCSTL